MNGNELKNEQTIPGKQFDKDYQPSPEAKKAGWKRRQEAQRIMNLMKDWGWKSYDEIIKAKEEIKKNPQKFTLAEVKLIQYLSSSRFTQDWLDRHISKAPQELDITSGGEKITGYTFEVVESKNEEKDTSDAPVSENTGGVSES